MFSQFPAIPAVLSPHDETTLTPLTQAEAQEAAAVIRAAFAVQDRPTLPPSSALRESAKSIAARIQVGGGVGARRNEILVGLALWQVVGPAAHLSRVSVLPDRRGAGIGRALMSACERIARDLSLERMILRVRFELVENQDFFRRCGFRRYGIEILSGEVAPAVVLMEKQLS
jgi:ribosomal protein S18 acetylase RimI-like enzyme